MTPRKPVRHPAAQLKSHKESCPGASAASRLLILVEQMQGRFGAVFEAINFTRRTLEESIEEMRFELQSEMGVLTSAVQQNSENVRHLQSAVQQNSEDIRHLQQA